MKVQLLRKANKELFSLNQTDRDRILAKLKTLEQSVFSMDVKKLSKTNYYRLRVGDYRVIFSIEGTLITVIKIGHRREIYR